VHLSLSHIKGYLTWLDLDCFFTTTTHCHTPLTLPQRLYMTGF